MLMAVVQWVPLYITFLAFFFYLPRYIWLKMEGGLMKLFRKGTTARLVRILFWEVIDHFMEKRLNYRID